MSVNYAADVETARMEAVVTKIDAGAAAGKLELGTSGMAATLISMTLSDSCGSVSGSTLTFAGFPKTAAASSGGKILAARIRDSDNNDCVTGLTVGLNSTVAPAWAGTTAYSVGNFRSNGANIYKCVTAGTSAGSGGPTGTGTGITDGSVTWDYYCPAGADIQMDNIEVNASQNFTISTAPTLTHA